MGAALFAAPALLFAAWPAGARYFEYDRAALAAGEIWRAATAHWTHWSTDHLLWDLVAFVALLVACWRVDVRRTLATLALSALLIPAVLWVAEPDLSRYRGLSGIDSALFALLAVLLSAQAVRERRPALAVVIAATVAGFAGKIAYETATGAAFFVREGGFVAVPRAHVAGVAAGVLAALVAPVRFSTRRSPCSSRCSPSPS